MFHAVYAPKNVKTDEKLRTHNMGSSEWSRDLFNIKAYTQKTFKSEKSLRKSIRGVMQIVMPFFDTNTLFHIHWICKS